MSHFAENKKWNGQMLMLTNVLFSMWAITQKMKTLAFQFIIAHCIFHILLFCLFPIVEKECFFVHQFTVFLYFNFVFQTLFNFSLFSWQNLSPACVNLHIIIYAMLGGCSNPRVRKAKEHIFLEIFCFIWLYRLREIWWNVLNSIFFVDI